MGLDIGDKRIGAALSDPMEILASPVTIINRREDENDIRAIVDIIQKNEVELIVAGLPYNMDGSLGYQAEKVRDFINVLSSHTGIPIEFRDERLTTWEAREKLQSAGKADRKTRYDAAAAALILQSYLDEKSR